jgi:signal transduction histidine kinase/CheY-like chemotaxis protein
MSRSLSAPARGGIGEAFSHQQDDRERTEWSQAVVRLVIGAAAAVYIFVRLLVAGPHEAISPLQRAAIWFYVPLFFAVAAGLLVSIRRRPGHVVWRRLLAMALDYVSLGLTMILGGAVMAPLAVIIVSATVGYGVRYGPAYLGAATAIAAASVAAVVVWTPYWRTQPDAVATLVVLLLSAPVYTMTLLRQSDAARRAETAAALGKSRFLAQASHDLRQPIHAIGLFVTTLRGMGLDKTQLAVVDRIDRSLRGVAHLFKSLLDISTLDSGAVKPQPRAFPIWSLLDEARRRHAEAAAWVGVEVRVVRTGLAVAADPALLATMLDNLIDNALKHAGGARLLIGCRRRGGLVSLVVCDQGAGIGPEHLPRLGELFYRVDAAGGRDRQGVGLGLSIVDRLARLSGLQLRLSSRPGRGVTAEIGGLMPAAGFTDGRMTGGGAIPAAWAAAADALQPPQPLAGVRVVLIEDDPDLLAATCDLLTSWRCEVQAFSAAPWLVRPSEIRPFDIIITDMDIGGGVTGVDCIRELRAEAARSDAANVPPAVILTGYRTDIPGRLWPERSLTLSKPAAPQAIRDAMTALLAAR